MSFLMLHFILISAGVAVVMAAASTRKAQEILRRAIRTWVTILVVGFVFALLVEFAQRPEDLLYLF